MLSLEQLIIIHHAKDSYLALACQSNQNLAVRIVKAFEARKELPEDHFDKIIKERLSEALLSPVGWVRERARKLFEEKINEELLLQEKQFKNK